MTVERTAWQGLISGRMDPQSAIVVELPLAPSPAGGSGTFLAEGSDRQRWWVKPLNNLQGPRVVITEHIVGRAGALVRAPLCDVAVVEIPEEVAGWEFRPGAHLAAGFAHASLAVSDARESRVLEHRDRDDNARRHAGVCAVHDWCWGNDDQWLYCESDDRKLYSHDHGYYLPPGGPNWDEASVVAHVDQPHPLSSDASGLDLSELAGLATRLREPLREPLREILNGVPASWPVTDSELEAVGFFLERRAPKVAERLITLSGGTR